MASAIPEPTIPQPTDLRANAPLKIETNTAGMAEIFVNMITIVPRR
jgi:hypothetical protein